MGDAIVPACDLACVPAGRLAEPGCVLAGPGSQLAGQAEPECVLAVRLACVRAGVLACEPACVLACVRDGEPACVLACVLAGEPGWLAAQAEVDTWTRLRSGSG